jgi:hypothetical protein
MLYAIVASANDGRRRAQAVGSIAVGVAAHRPANRVAIPTIDTIGPDDEPDDHSPERLQRALRWHNPNVLMHWLAREHGTAAETLLQAAVWGRGPTCW